ncbi:M14 family metallopeptidase [Candidatus Methylomicrobium oryzae]|uniref:M14 family metallopeptidase n=1 Tax=Candidatus Methylomicrobium oryzae TaxID=2802053 RepID=UPI001923BB07|nr:M14 family metallopeptidase [Methylomicrobium sp. RS1]MBL1265646.1 succinylglutamate desuccinylase/aspartoacylase family protein [Methylomicrobium sp. RS1]
MAVTERLFTQLDSLPAGLLDIDTVRLRALLPKPTLIHLAGRLDEPLFVSVLLHGNEPTGFMAVQRLLKKYRNRELPRSLALFLGNVDAAARDVRRLEHQPDYNRIWPGTELPASPETAMAAAVFEAMRERRPFASIDIHNNTGLNPHYACINRLDNRFLQLATLFGRLVVYFRRPTGVQSAAFAELCPSVTIECGRPGQQYGVDHAFEFLDSSLHLSALPEQPVHVGDIDLFHTVAQARIADHVSFSFSRSDSDLLLSEDLERMNFTEIAAGTVLGQVSKVPLSSLLLVQNEQGHDVAGQFFGLHNGTLQIIRPTMPSMLTLDERVIRQDCLCYLMERLNFSCP